MLLCLPLLFQELPRTLISLLSHFQVKSAHQLFRLVWIYLFQEVISSRDDVMYAINHGYNEASNFFYASMEFRNLLLNQILTSKVCHPIQMQRHVNYNWRCNIILLVDLMCTFPEWMNILLFECNKLFDCLMSLTTWVTQAASLHKLESESFVAGRRLEEAVMRAGNSFKIILLLYKTFLWVFSPKKYPFP